MKTVTEASNEQYKLYKKAHDLVAEDMAISFKKGIEFAQRWIPVEEELPNTTEKILVKGKSQIVYLSYYNPKTNLFSSNCRITHWRPIHFL